MCAFLHSSCTGLTDSSVFVQHYCLNKKSPFPPKSALIDLLFDSVGKPRIGEVWILLGTHPDVKTAAPRRNSVVSSVASVCSVDGDDPMAPQIPRRGSSIPDFMYYPVGSVSRWQYALSGFLFGWGRILVAMRRGRILVAMTTAGGGDGTAGEVVFKSGTIMRCLKMSNCIHKSGEELSFWYDLPSSWASWTELLSSSPNRKHFY